MAELDGMDLDVVPSEAAIGELLKKATKANVKAGKGNFGVALDRTNLTGQVGHLLTDVWRGLQKLGDTGMDAFAVPLTFEVARKETSTALKISISGVTTRIFNLIPPRAYVYLQKHKSEMDQEDQKSDVIVVPGLKLRIFRLVGNPKAPETAKFISVEKKTGVASTKPFTVVIGDSPAIGPLYMPADRIQELVDRDGAAPAIVFAKKSAGIGEAGITDALLRSQEGAYMFILDKDTLRWVVTLDFSALYDEGPSTRRPNQPPVLRPQAPTDLPPPPPPAGAAAHPGHENKPIIVRTIKTETVVEKTPLVHNAVRLEEKIPALGAGVEGESKTKLIDYDARNFPASNKIRKDRLAWVTTSRADSMFDLLAVELAAPLVRFAQMPAVIAYFSQRPETLATTLPVLFWHLDRAMLSMDKALIDENPTLAELETPANNILSAVFCLNLSIYLRHRGRQEVLRLKLDGNTLPTWGEKSILLSQPSALGIFPSEYYDTQPAPADTSKAPRDIHGASLDEIINMFSVCKYLLAENRKQQKVDSSLKMALEMGYRTSLAIVKTAVEVNRGLDNTIPSILHIIAVITTAIGTYFLREGNYSSDTISYTLTKAAAVMNNAQMAKLVEFLKEDTA